MTSLLFYDLETSGINPREQRIMQFAAQRTDMQLNPIGDPYNILIKLTEDVLPDPEAILLTGITPQQTIAEGITEAEFLKQFSEEISTAGTIFVGFNSVRFDDEFIRFIHYRNFYDAYEWHWTENRGRWDLLDVVRMTRALRPGGIKWPVDSKGVPANRLELLTSINGLSHESAHDALSDVNATIALARLIRGKEPKLFDYLLSIRDKKSVSKLVNSKQPFVYTSGKYSNDFEKTTVVTEVCVNSKNSGSIVFDLRHDPTKIADKSVDELAEMWRHYCKEKPCPHEKLPVKTLQYNRCPAIAPLGVLDDDAQNRLGLSLDQIMKNFTALKELPDLADKLIKTTDLLDSKYQTSLIADELESDAKLYDGFFSDKDKLMMHRVQTATQTELKEMKIEFTDDRLNNLFVLYKSRNFPKTLNEDEHKQWQQFIRRKLLGGKQASRAAKFFDKLALLANDSSLNDKKRYLLEELQLYGQSIIPEEN